MTILIHHLQYSQSERIPWLCEELGVKYELKTYSRAPLLAPPEYKALHPMGTAPVIQDGDATLAESCACVEYISRKHAGGKLFLDASDPAFADFLFWWHWADGTLQPALGSALEAEIAGPSGTTPFSAILVARFKNALKMLDDRLRDNEWLAGSQFTVADIMVVFSLTTMRSFYGYSLREYESVVKYLQRVGERAAYQRAMKKSDPDMEPALGADPPKKFAP